MSFAKRLKKLRLDKNKELQGITMIEGINLQ